MQKKKKNSSTTQRPPGHRHVAFSWHELHPHAFSSLFLDMGSAYVRPKNRHFQRFLMKQINIYMIKQEVYFYFEIIMQQMVILSWAGRQVLSIQSLLIIPLSNNGHRERRINLGDIYSCPPLEKNIKRDICLANRYQKVFAHNTFGGTSYLAWYTSCGKQL